MSTPYYLNETNPEIYQMTPRAGGIAKIDDSLAKKKRGKSFVDVAASQSRMSTGGTSKTGASVVSTSTMSKSRTSRSRSIFDVSKEGQEKKEEKEPSREYKIHQTVSSFPWSAELDEDDPDVKKELPNPFQDSVDMLAIAISTIMLLAAGYGDIPKNHMVWALSYLECIKDEFGNYPPNVRGMLNHINNVTGGQLTSFNVQDMEELNDYLSPRGVTVSFAGNPEAASTPKANEEE